MSNEIESNRGEDSGVQRPESGNRAIPLPDMFEDIGQGYVRLRPPATLDDIPFPPDDPERTADYNWAQEDPEMQARYGGRVVAVRHKRVWGV
ncbi:MAG TPA: hypothetical protein VFW33_22960, partial [Gemmataceae bacterium]|nr:hypothetical protein [Gemmataceae bacterium]